MSWIPRVQQWSSDNERLLVTINYFDNTDTGRLNTLAQQTFIVQPDEVDSPAKLGSRIRLWGANAKQAQVQLAAANIQFPPGFELTAIP